MATISKPTTETACWKCGAETAGGHFCAACGTIQPLPRNADYFAFFGLPQKLQLDVADLEKRFHQLSWKLHPDNFVRAEENEGQLALDRSSQLNDAFRALRDPVRRVEYLLLLHGARKEGTTKQQAPPELLEEVFELNESLDELRSARQSANNEEMAELKTRLQAAEENFEEKLRSVDAELKKTFAEWDAALASGDDARKKAVARLNEILNRRAYIRNLVANVAKELSES